MFPKICDKDNDYNNCSDNYCLHEIALLWCIFSEEYLARR